MKIKIAALFIGVVVFFIGVFTLVGYGINWDTINHLPRGQAYLHYFLTGKKDYSDFPSYFNDWNNPNMWYWQHPSSLAIDTNLAYSKVPTRSMYQIDSANFNYFIENDGNGHPPLSDILSSAFNRLLFGKLRIVNDIDSYRVYGVLLSAILVGLIFWWSTKLYGKAAGIISAASLLFYPLFFSEMHFNTEKDVPETAYWSFMFFAVWQAITKKSWKWTIMSGVFFGLALGTKFNILFAIIALVPWIFLYVIRNKKEFKIRKTIVLLFSSFFAFVIGIAIFIGTWPYLWPDPIARISGVIGFYKGIGTTTGPVDPRFLSVFGTNTYSIQWIIYTTPVIILFFALIGIVIALKRVKKEKDIVSILFILWFLVPIARVSWSGANTYGGVRQIMEYIPAMAVLAGIGGAFILHRLKIRNLFLKIGYMLLVLGVLVSIVIRIHPNENVYFNFLIGGIDGAKVQNIPYWGFSFGSAYRQGIEWIDEHAEKNANVVYAYELIPNIPRLWIRPDLVLSNGARSGYLAKGEYVITLTYQGTNTRSYFDSYLEKFLKPVYEVKVDEVSILKVWKNDKEHMYSQPQESLVKNVQIQKTNNGIIFDLGGIKLLSRLDFSYKVSKECVNSVDGYSQISKDGENWDRLPGVIPDDWGIPVLGKQPTADNHFIEPFVGESARYIYLSISPINTCLKNITSYGVYYFR